VATELDSTDQGTHRSIEDGVAAVGRRFGDDYWLECDLSERFPEEFHRAMAADGWLGVTMPEEYGGAGAKVTDAAIVIAHGGQAWGSDSGLDARKVEGG
jgi:alkylation response protein AidB-like acyl-CoA dehydrogenase